MILRCVILWMVLKQPESWEVVMAEWILKSHWCSCTYLAVRTGMDPWSWGGISFRDTSVLTAKGSEERADWQEDLPCCWKFDHRDAAKSPVLMPVSWETTCGVWLWPAGRSEDEQLRVSLNFQALVTGRWKPGALGIFKSEVAMMCRVWCWLGEVLRWWDTHGEHDCHVTVLHECYNQKGQ